MRRLTGSLACKIINNILNKNETIYKPSSGRKGRQRFCNTYPTLSTLVALVRLQLDEWQIDTNCHLSTSVEDQCRNCHLEIGIFSCPPLSSPRVRFQWALPDPNSDCQMPGHDQYMKQIVRSKYCFDLHVEPALLQLQSLVKMSVGIPTPMH